MNIQKQFHQAIENNDIKNVKLLLNDNRVNPADLDNWTIRNASIEGHCDIVNLLWQDQIVKNTLKKDNEELYNELVKKDKIKEKIGSF